MKVFIADGSSCVRKRLHSLLSEISGIEIVGHAGDGEEAMALIRACEPGVVILDGSLPPDGGLGLLRRLKSISPAPVVIAITSFSNLQYRTRFHEAGAAYFFEKPRELDRLVEALISLKQEIA